MGVEIEAKMKVADLDSIRQKLIASGAKRKKSELETNTFFDTDSASLKSADKGLRLRIAKNLANGEERFIITMKGPLQKSELKTREEIELTVSDPKATSDLFASLGFKRQLSFEKRRETWEFEVCEIALDEMPLLGTFVEIEGKNNEKVMSARKALGLADLPLINTGYIALLAKYLQEHRIESREIKL